MNKRLIVALAAAAASVVPAQSALAATATVTGNVNAGTLSISTSATPSFSVTLDGTDKTGSYTVPTTVTDATGSGAGWNLTITSTQFTTGGGSPSTLATNASSITGVTNTCATTCVSPTNSTTYPVGVPAGSSPPTAVKYFNAAATTGGGKFTNTPAVDVSVPANSAVGTYSSTLTLAAVSGP
jgi:putative surface cell wall-binding protein